MGKIFNQTKTELRQLPLMLGKLIGGLTAVIGFTAAVISARKPGLILQDILPSFLLVCAGIIIFILSARALSRRLSSHAVEVSQPVNSFPMNKLSWDLLLLFAGIFLVCVYFFTR